MAEEELPSDSDEPAPPQARVAAEARAELEVSQGTAKLLDSLLDRLAGPAKPSRNPEQLILRANLTVVIGRREPK